MDYTVTAATTQPSFLLPRNRVDYTATAASTPASLLLPRNRRDYTANYRGDYTAIATGALQPRGPA